MSKKRNGNIELLRIIFAFIILIYHLFGHITTHSNIPTFRGGYLGVEFFFIITGVFLGQSFKYKHINKNENLERTLYDSRNYLLKKIKSIYPYFIISWLIGFTVQIISGLGKNVFTSISDLLFLQNLGFPTTSATGTVWYLSAMFISLFFLYPILHKYYNVYVKYLAPFIVFYFTGYIMHNFGNMNQCVSKGIIDIGILRAFSDISFGLIINEISQKLKTFELSKNVRFLITAFEFIGYILIFTYITFLGKTKFDGIVFLFLGFCVLLTISNQSYLYGKFDNKITILLGKFSMPLFMNHYYWVVHFNKFLIDNNYLQQKYSILLTVCLSIITSIIVYLFGNKISETIKTKFKHKSDT